MQTFKTVIKIVALIFTATLSSFAQTDNKKTKDVHASYPLSANNNINLKNQYGNITIEVWDKNEITVDVSIHVSSNSEQRSEKLLNAIQIQHGTSNNQVFFKTEIEATKGSWKGTQNMQIDYVVHLPANKELKVNNTYGNVILPNYTGATQITVGYGNLTAGVLSNTANEIKVTYGNLALESAVNADIDVAYSGCTIKTLAGNSRIDLAYCKNVTLGINQSTGTTKIKNAYSGTVAVNVADDASASFEIEANYGKATNQNNNITGLPTNSEEEMTHRSATKVYNGKIGDGKAKIKINSSYSNIVLR
jgi:hypothetical protein